jgi:preprotein translocase subunit YajC
VPDTRPGRGRSVIATAWAQQGGAPVGPSPAQLLPFLLMLAAVWYVLVVRPEQKKRQQQEKMLADLKRNDSVVLASGLHGRIMALGDDVITVEIAPRVQVQVDRSAVQRIVGVAEPEGRDKERQRS